MAEAIGIIMQNLTSKFLAETEAAINAAISISDVTRIARTACGYHVTHATVEYTDADRAWFKRPVGGAL